MATAVNFLLALYVFLTNPRNLVNLSFSVLVFINTAYSLVLFLLTSFPLFLEYPSLYKSIFIIPSLIPLAFYMFSRLFPDPPPNLDLKRILTLYSVVPVFIFLMSFTDYVLQSTVITQWGIRPVYGPFFKIYVLYFLVYLFMSIHVLVSKYKKFRGIEKVQTAYALLGMIVPFVLVVMAVLVLPLLGIRQLSQTGPLFTIIMVLVISYAILKHRLMDIRIVLRSSLIYSILTIVMASILVGFLLILKFVYAAQEDLSAIVFISIVVSIIISVALHPLKSHVEKGVDHYFFRGRYHYQQALRGFSRDLANLLDLPTLKEFLVRRLVETMQVQNGDLVLLEQEANGALNSRAQSSADLCLMGPAGRRVFRMLSEGKDIVVLEELKRSLPREEYKEVVDVFEGLKAAVLIPLITHGSLIGLISLGEKRSGDIFSLEDITFLSTLGNQASISIQNAMLYNQILEIKDYNEEILAQMASGVITVDKHMQITTFNKRAEEITGVAAKAVIGSPVDRLQREFGRLLEAASSSNYGLSNVEVYISTPKAAGVPLNLSTTPLRNPSGQVIGALAVFTDLTEIKQLEAEVRRAERLATVGTLAAGMAHEIKNPLVSLKTFSQLLPIKYNDPEFRDTFSQIVGQEVERMNSLVEQLLRFAKPSRPDFQPVDVHKPIEETFLLLASELSKRNVEVVKQFAQEPITILADGEQLKQVLLNIMLNALDALSGRDPARLSIATELEYRWGGRNRVLPKLPEGYGLTGQEVFIRISDNGVGIPEEELKHIFDPFFTTKDRGHGLGLSIAHGIIREHRGAVTAQSRPGEGTTFQLAFPVITQQTGEREDAPDEIRLDRLA